MLRKPGDGGRRPRAILGTQAPFGMAGTALSHCPFRRCLRLLHAAVRRRPFAEAQRRAEEGLELQ